MQAAAMDRDRSPRRVHRHYQPVLRHLQSWADGACTTPQVWLHIDALAAEGIEHPAVQRIHALATHIRDQNLCSSLVSLLTETCKLGNFIYSIPDRDCSVDHCLRPGQMISLMRNNPSKFKLHMGADTELLAEFWDGYRRSDVGKRYCAMHVLIYGTFQTMTTDTLCHVFCTKTLGRMGWARVAPVRSYLGMFLRGEDLTCKRSSCTIQN